MKIPLPIVKWAERRLLIIADWFHCKADRLGSYRYRVYPVAPNAGLDTLLHEESHRMIHAIQKKEIYSTPYLALSEGERKWPEGMGGVVNDCPFKS